jgi:hypothetical protein
MGAVGTHREKKGAVPLDDGGDHDDWRIRHAPSVCRTAQG